MKLFIKRSVKEYVLYSAITVVGIILDQLTKLLAALYLKGGDAVTVIPGVVQLRYVENRGAAFGMLADSRWVFMIISVAMILGIGSALFLGHVDKLRIAVPMAMVLSGGIGNMIDRIFLGYVIDFIEPTFIDFAVFNGADSFVCVGGAVLFFVLLVEIFKEEKAKKAASAAEASTEDGER